MYYFNGVNKMNLILDLIYKITIIFIIFLSKANWSKVNWGSVADWVSGIGSLGAIIFAYWRMHVQKNKEEEDEILANRPYFSCTRLYFLRSGVDHLWITSDDNFNKAIDNIFLKKSTDQIKFKDGIYAYELKNVSRAVATNIVLKIVYYGMKSNTVLKINYCNIGTSVIGNERAIILPHNLITEPILFRDCPKRIYLYSMSIDNIVYRQSWIQKSNETGICIQQVDIKEVPIEEMPNGEVCMRIPL